MVEHLNESFAAKRNYELVELIAACIAIFLFKKGSRNAFNNERSESKFKKNFQKIFNITTRHSFCGNNTLNMV